MNIELTLPPHPQAHTSADAPLMVPYLIVVAIYICSLDQFTHFSNNFDHKKGVDIRTECHLELFGGGI